jgi:hypothetical protein
MKKLLIALLSTVALGAGCFGATSPTPTPNPTPTPSVPQASDTGCSPKAITVLEPKAGDTVKLPLTVKVRIHNAERPNCHWSVSEAVAGPIKLLDKDGVTVGAGSLTTTQDWMTDGPVEFTGEIPALALVEGQATLVITEDNAAGKPDPQEVMIPVNVTR